MAIYSFGRFRSLVSKGSKVLGVLLAACFLLSQVPCASAAEKDYPAWASLGGKIGNHDRYLGLLDVFVPLTQTPDGLWFTDLRLKDASGPEAEFNIGTGYRRMINDTWILGVYGFYDNLRSAHENYFQQGTIGMEALTKEWDFRVNAYFPETEKDLLSSTSSATIDISGNTITTSTTSSKTWEQALPGFDAEVGYRLPGSQDIRVYAGGFYFDRSGAPTISGPRARTEWRLEDFLGFKGTRLTVSGEYSHDQVRNDQVYAGLAVRIPFGPGAVRSNETEKGSLKSRMIEPIVRDVDIVSGEGETTTATHNLPAINPNTGLTYTSIYYAAASSIGDEDGSSPDNAESLPDAIDDAGTDGVVAVLDSEGDFIVDYADLQSGQTVIGSTGTLLAQAGSESGPLASTVIPGDDRPVLHENDGADYIIGLDHDNTVSDIQITPSGEYGGVDYVTGIGYGIEGSGSDTGYDSFGGKAWLKNVDVSGVDYSGVSIDGDGTNDVVIDGSNIRNNDQLEDGYGNLDIQNVQDVNIASSSFAGEWEGSPPEPPTGHSYGIDIENVAGDVTITDTWAENNYFNGIYLFGIDGNVTISDTTANHNDGEEGLDDPEGFADLYIENAGDVIVTSSNFKESQLGRGVDIRNVNSVKFTDVTASDNVQDNILISGVTGVNDGGNAISLHGVTANGATDGDGVYIEGTNGGAILIDQDSQFNNNFSSNIEINNDPSTGDVTISNFQSEGAGGFNIYIDGADDISVQDPAIAVDDPGLYLDNCNSYNGDPCVL